MLRAHREGRTELRMDFSQRAQHLVLALSFILLALTGFALKYPSSWLAGILGSNESIRRWGHRIAGIVLLLAGAYHVGYVLSVRQGRKLIKDMIPNPKDARDIAANVQYLTGLAKEKPKFGRFGYTEKMEYWAVVWGTIIMGATGLMIWFKLATTHWLPRWSIDVATTIHYYEAILACLAIVVWHFYEVIFDPDIYPLNRACVDGRVSPEWQAEEHVLDTRAPTLPATNGRSAWLKGGAAKCAIEPSPRNETARLVLLGAPGVGKGTQAQLLHERTGACHLSTGDIFRAAKDLPAGERTPAIEKALSCMARGGLVSDTTVLGLICERVQCLHCVGGFLLDGFPRTVSQAEALDQLLKTENLTLTAVIDYEMPIDEIVGRLAGRRVCSDCKSVLHVNNAQSSLEICPQCGGKLLQREDDRPEAIRVRMAAYHTSTEPLIEYYRRQGLLLSVSAEGTPGEIMQRTVDALASRPRHS